MAINLTTNVTYSGRITVADANYPYGSSKNESSPGANDGTPYEKTRADDIFGFQQAVLKSVGAVPTGNADTALDSQYLKSLNALMSGYAAYRETTGTADAIVLSPAGDSQGVDDLLVGTSYRFRATATNTTSAVANIDGTGDLTIKTSAGGNLPAGYLRTDVDTVLTFDGTNLVAEPYAATETLIKITRLTSGTSVTLDPQTKTVFGYAVGAGTDGVLANFPGEAGGTAFFKGDVTGGSSLTYAIGARSGANTTAGTTSITIGATTFSGFGGTHTTTGGGYAGGYSSIFGGAYGGASNKGTNTRNAGGDSFLGGAGVVDVTSTVSALYDAQANSGSGGAMSVDYGGTGADGCIILMEYR